VLEKEKVFARLENLGALLETEIRSALKSAGLAYSFYRYGSMFCLFFTARPVRNLADAQTADLPRFARFFHALLDAGIYLAPSQFETGFLSAAHTEQDIEETARRMREALRA
jgi:glutamate-1-semialdehyde 2,1-aminomutase